MAAFQDRSDENLDPAGHDLATESRDPAVIRAVRVSSPHGLRTGPPGDDGAKGRTGTIQDKAFHGALTCTGSARSLVATN